MSDDVTVLAGTLQPESEPWEPFDPRIVRFLSDLSDELLHGQGTREWEAALGFWCRRAHLHQLELRHACPLPRLGRGLVFHIAPANVPAQFAYSLAIGLLAGNANVVRLSSRSLPENEALLALLSRLMGRPEHAAVKARISLILCGQESGVIAALCRRCDARVIWGGDSTVAALRAMPMPPHAVEVAFPDRWSMAVFSQAVFSALSTRERRALAHRFYNDTYQLDQNACSSPQMILWLEDGGVRDCRRLWWEAVAAEAEDHYSFGPYQATQKLERLCRYTMTTADPMTAAVQRYGGNLLYVVQLDQLPKDPTALRGGYGLFFECSAAALEELLPVLNPKVQTLVCGGLDPGETASFLARNRARGVVRVITLGQALEMDTVWDGKDLIAALSRLIG